LYAGGVIMNCPVCENIMNERLTHFKCSKCGTVMNKTHKKAELRKQIPESQLDELVTFLKQVWKFVFFKIGGVV